MTIREFFETHAGKATLAVFACALHLAFPPALAWTVAAGLLWYAARHLRLAFIAAEREQRVSIMEEIAEQRAALLATPGEDAAQAA
jgi:hypothetical protein